MQKLSSCFAPKHDLNNSKEVICYLLRNFYKNGWCTGSGGGISIKDADDCVYIAPSGVQKELVQPEDMFQLDIKGNQIKAPQTPNLKQSECTPLFCAVYQLRKAGAVIHSHSLNAMLVTKIFDTEFQIIDLEMIKGIKGHKNTEWCRVPIIENTERECTLTERLRKAIIANPRSNGVLVRNHGFYVWGDNWEHAKIQAECYDYLFQAALEIRKLNLPNPKTRCPDRSIQAWFIDEEKAKIQDKRESLQYHNPQWVSGEILKKLGVLYWNIDTEEQLIQISKERNYGSQDEVKIGEGISQDYESKLTTFFTEHLHADEEIRYIPSGSGYFDIRDHKERWIRIHVGQGDLLILPEGIYHRFTTDLGNFVHARRLFKDEPKWTPYNRPQDKHASRLKYLEQFHTQDNIQYLNQLQEYI